MQEPTFLILTALAAGPQHGYGIIADVLQLSGERVRLRAGTLYAALDRLREEGLIEIEGEEIVDGRVRRYYRLTPPGRDRLAAEAEHLRRNAEAAVSRLRARPLTAFTVGQSAVRAARTTPIAAPGGAL
jgi:DNA-binding PadR family transcriptional regulator